MKRSDIETGLAAPILWSGGVATAADWRNSDPRARSTPFSMHLRMTEEGRANGERLCAMVRDAVKRVIEKGPRNEKAVREMRRLVGEIWSIVRHVPEFIDFMNWLAKHDLGAANKILEVVPRLDERVRESGRGRRHQPYAHLVAMVDLVRTQEGGSVAKACQRLLSEVASGPFRHYSTSRSMERDYSEHHERIHAEQEVWISGEDLARVPCVLGDER